MTVRRCLPLLLVLFLVVLGAPLSGMAATEQKATIEEVKKETQEFLLALKAYSATQRDEAIARTRAVLADLDTHIEALEAEIDANWETMSQAARAEAQASLRALRKQRNDVAEAYGRWRESSAAGWDELKKGFAEAYADLQRAWEKAEQEFGAQR